MSRKISTCSNQWPAKYNKNCCLLPVASIKHRFGNAGSLLRPFTPPFLSNLSSGKLCFYQYLNFSFTWINITLTTSYCLYKAIEKCRSSFFQFCTDRCLPRNLQCRFHQSRIFDIKKILTHLKGLNTDND